MLGIIRKELKLLVRGKGNFFFLILMPILFIVLFGSIFSGIGNSSLTVNYVDLDHSPISRQLVQEVGHIKGFVTKTDTSATLQAQIQQVKNGKLSSLLVIPKGFGTNILTGAQPAKLAFYQNATDSSLNGPIASALQAISGGYQTQHQVAVLRKEGVNPATIQKILQPTVHIQSIQENGTSSNLTMIEQVVPGYTVMFVFFIILNMMRSFIGEKESGMLSRLRSTPMKPLTYLIGMWIPALIAVLIQCVILLGFGHFAYGVKLGNLGAISVIVLALGICGTGIGLAISLLVRGENQGRGITMLISIGGAAVGGLWAPTQLMPQFVQTIGYFTPQYWAQSAFQAIMMRGAQIGDVWKTLVILLAFGVGGLVVALWRFPHFLQTASD